MRVYISGPITGTEKGVMEVMGVKSKSTVREEYLASAIYPSDLSAVRKRLSIGKKVKLKIKSRNYEDDGQEGRTLTKTENCIVTGMYQHIVTFRRPCRMETSYTYQELIMMGI